MKKDSAFKKVMETQKILKDSEGFDWLESTELAIDKRKFLLNRLHEKKPIPQDQDWSFPGPLYCCVSIKTVNNQTLLMTSLQPFAFQIAVYFTLFVVSF